MNRDSQPGAAPVPPQGSVEHQSSSPRCVQAPWPRHPCQLSSCKRAWALLEPLEVQSLSSPRLGEPLNPLKEGPASYQLVCYELPWMHTTGELAFFACKFFTNLASSQAQNNPPRLFWLNHGAETFCSRESTAWLVGWGFVNSSLRFACEFSA